MTNKTERNYCLEEAFKYFYGYRIYVDRFGMVIDDMSHTSSVDAFNVTFEGVKTDGFYIISKDEPCHLIK